MKKVTKRKGGSKGGRKDASASKNDDATATRQETQPSQDTQVVEPKVEESPVANEEEAKPDDDFSTQQEKEGDEAKPDEKKDPDVSEKDETKGASSSEPKTDVKKEVAEKPLRRGKRQRTPNTETEKKATPRAKRAKASKPLEAAPEFIKEKRSLEDLWKAAFPVGTGWDQLDELHEFEWDFTNLEEALQEGGNLCGKKVYVFGCTESQVVADKKKNKTILVPTVVCVESSIPPSDKIGVTSGPSQAEEIIPMKDMKMAWVPYIPLDKRDKQVDRKNFTIFVLGCTQRRSALKHLKDDRVKKFNNCLPYINNPFKEGEPELTTVVQITFPSDPPVEREYDWEKNDLEEFTNDLINEGALHQNKKYKFKKFVKRQCAGAKKTYEEISQAKEALEETKEAYTKMRLHKFYPVASPATPDLSGIVKTPFINKYFGNAHNVL